jgi:hypothetical protein
MDVHRWPTHEDLFSSVSCVTPGNTRDRDELEGSEGEGHHARLFWVPLTNLEEYLNPVAIRNLTHISKAISVAGTVCQIICMSKHTLMNKHFDMTART